MGKNSVLCHWPHRKKADLCHRAVQRARIHSWWLSRFCLLFSFQCMFLLVHDQKPSKCCLETELWFLILVCSQDHLMEKGFLHSTSCCLGQHWLQNPFMMTLPYVYGNISFSTRPPNSSALYSPSPWNRINCYVEKPNSWGWENFGLFGFSLQMQKKLFAVISIRNNICISERLNTSH